MTRQPGTRAEPSKPQDGGSGDGQPLSVCVQRLPGEAPHPERKAGLSWGGRHLGALQGIPGPLDCLSPTAHWEHTAKRLCSVLRYSVHFAGIVVPEEASYLSGGWGQGRRGRRGRGGMWLDQGAGRPQTPSPQNEEPTGTRRFSGSHWGSVSVVTRVSRAALAGEARRRNPFRVCLPSQPADAGTGPQITYAQRCLTEKAPRRPQPKPPATTIMNLHAGSVMSL